jgi:hypothetical protein
MKARFLLVLFVFLLPLGGHAQHSDRIEVLGGYSYTGYSVYGLYSGPWKRQDFNGWEASATAKTAPHVEVEADFAGGYSPTNPYNLRTYMGGPRVSVNLSRLAVYGHILVGGLSFNQAADYSGGSATSFAAALGGGADVWFMRHIGARLIQIDYLRNNSMAAAQAGEGATKHYSNFRIVTGFVFRFGH